MFRDKYLKAEDRLLIYDVGSCDVNGTYRELFADWAYRGIDICAGPNVDVVVSAEEDSCWLDAVSQQADVVVTGQCMEHVRKPWKWIRQVSSILLPDGLIFMTAPNTWRFHEHPIDCWRVFPDGAKALFEDGGIETIETYMYGDTEYDTVAIGRKK